MSNGLFYIKLAWSNIKRGKLTFLPYFIATATLSGVYFLIAGLLQSKGLSNTPSGSTAQMIFALGIFLFTVFSFLFMQYVNTFLIKRRKKEFGLYSVLGMEKRHVSRVLCIESFIIIFSGCVTGMLIGALLGRLLFLVLLKLINAAPDSVYDLPPIAIAQTAALFTVIFLVITFNNSRKLRKMHTADLLQSERAGEALHKTPVIPAAIGLILLLAMYIFAQSMNNQSVALGLFFPMAFVVILADFLLFIYGSIAALSLLRKNKRLYYKADNFIAISGMFHRMRQNAAGLAAICVLSTMLLVTVAGTLSLYTGQESMLNYLQPADVAMYIPKDTPVEKIEQFDDRLPVLAQEYGVTMKKCESFVLDSPDNENIIHELKVATLSDIVQLKNASYTGRALLYDIEGQDADCVRYCKALKDAYTKEFDVQGFRINTYYGRREESYGVFGGLLFLGAFFSILFLTGTVLIIYFKQITEGYEDKERFEILQKVGMDDKQVKSTINRQIIWVFFLPLAGAFCNVAFAGKMIAVMLQLFGLCEHWITYACTFSVSAVFAIFYIIVYGQTAKVYYNIVKWEN